MVMEFNTTFNNISVLYRGGQFFSGGVIIYKPKCPEKTAGLPQVADKLYHIM